MAARGRSVTAQHEAQGRRASSTSIILALAFFAGASLPAVGSATQDLRPLLNAPGSTVTLDGATVYTISEYHLSGSKTLLCNGATIQSTGGPIRVSGIGNRLTVDDCVIQGTGWALLAAVSGGDLEVRNDTRLSGNASNTAVYVHSSTLDLSDGSIQGCQWGVSMVNADALLRGVSITATLYAVQNVAGSVTLEEGCYLEGSHGAGPGIGLSLIASPSFPARGAAAVVHDSNFVGFTNAIDVQPSAAQGLPPGTLEVVGSRFDDPVSSAMITIDAVNVRFAHSQVNRSQTDGIWMVNSTGVIEYSEIVGSLNTGVTFLGCPNGVTLRNSLVSGAVHQAVAVGLDAANNRASRFIRIVDNTLKDNVIANVYVDAFSEALVQGNLMSGAPDFSVRVHGSPRVDTIGNLLLDSHRGLEVRDGDRLTAALSYFTGHDRGGVLVYNGAVAGFAHCAHQDNLRDGLAGDSSVFANTGGQITLRRNALGPAATPALFNNAGNVATATKSYWSDASGPRVPNGSASGAVIGWNPANGSSVAYQPFLTTAPLDATVHRTFNMTAGATTSWTPTGDLSLRLTGAAGIPATSRVVGALRVRDTASVTTPPPPSGTMKDGILALWVDYDLLSRAQTGSLRLRTIGSGATARLYRLRPGNAWTVVATTWDGANGQVVYNPSDPHDLNGVFALVDSPPEWETRARDLITSYYRDILGRDPEPGAVDSWYHGYFAYALSFGIDVRFMPQEMGRLFFSSAGYAARNRTDEQFIRDCYRVFSRREPSQSEVNGWLGGTWNRPQAVTLFSRSAAFESYIQGLFPGLNGVPTRNLVTTMYIGLLDRLVDSGGLAYFSDLFEWAYTRFGIEGARNEARQLGRALMSAPGYTSQNPTNTTHVERLYRAFLGRYPATNELDYWRGELDAGRQTTDTLIDAFAAAPGFTTRLNTYFNQL